MKHKYALNFVIALLAISPLVFLATIYNKLPGIVPVHYDIHLTPDKMDKKQMLWFVNGALAIVSIVVYFLLLNLHRFDPKRKNHTPSGSFKRLAVVVVIFLTVINFLMLLSVNNNIRLSQKLLLAVLGLLIAALGNYMSTIKPNYFAGLRLPWTLSSDYNWKKTHLMAGMLWFWGGLISVIIVLLVPSSYAAQIFFSLLGIIVIIPIIYSYRLFIQEKEITPKQ